MPLKIPKHIALILDGNRRYAKKLSMQPWKGHEFGAKKLEELLKWCQDIGVKELTLYAFSTENFSRPQNEKDFLFNLFKKEFNSLNYQKSIDENKIKITVFGRLNMFPEDIRKLMLEIMDKTKNNDKFTLNFAMAYGGRQEIVDSVKKIAQDVKDNLIHPSKIDEKNITDNLYLQSEPQMVIRPGGEKRTSNFLTWQSTYSEWVFVDKLWPEFTKEDLLKCIKEYNGRGRRFGK